MLCVQYDKQFYRNIIECMCSQLKKVINIMRYTVSFALPSFHGINSGVGMGLDQNSRPAKNPENQSVFGIQN